MGRRSLLESYALVACFGMLVCFTAALYFLGHGIIAREAPEYTINRWVYNRHQTNERYWEDTWRWGQKPRPPEATLTAVRERSWRAELQLESRYGTRDIWLSGLGLMVSSAVFWVHWRVARRARRESREARIDVPLRPIVLASAIVFGFGCCFGTGLVGGLMVSEGGNYSSRVEEEWRAVAPVLGSDPAFAGVEIHQRSDGGICLWGTVPTGPDLERLHTQIARVLGEQRGREAMNAVRARTADTDPPR